MGPEAVSLAGDESATGAGHADGLRWPGVRLAAPVMFVHDLDLSVSFYRELLSMKVTVRSNPSALLVTRTGCSCICGCICGRSARMPSTRWAESASST